MWFIAGILLTGLVDAAVTNNASAGRVGSLFDLVGAAMSRIIDPSVPAIPNTSGYSPTTPSSSAPAATPSTSGPLTMAEAQSYEKTLERQYPGQAFTIVKNPTGDGYAVVNSQSGNGQTGGSTSGPFTGTAGG